MSTLLPITTLCSKGNAWHFWFTSVILVGLVLAWAAYIFCFFAWKVLCDPEEYENEYERWWKRFHREVNLTSRQARKDVLISMLNEVDADFRAAQAALEEVDREDQEREKKKAAERNRMREAERSRLERARIRRGRQSAAMGSQSSGSRLQ
jgi:predicted alpha/beta hydrolase